MRLQDLRDDLTFHEANKFPDPLNPCVVVARRVADLYDECHNCQFQTLGEDADTYACPRCGEAGADPTEKACMAFGGSVPLLALARYLFGGRAADGLL